MKDYYFVTYQWKSLVDDGEGVVNAVTSIHPLDWFIEQFEHDRDNTYKILFWKKISYEHYKLIGKYI